MTIIAGFPTKGFVVLGADGEEGTSHEKSAVKKIAHLSGDGYSCLLGGAGDGDFVDLAIQEAGQLLPGLGPDVSSIQVRTLIEDVVTDIHAERIDTVPDGEPFHLLCALWTAHDPQPQLVKVGRAVSLVRDRPEAIGVGSYLARYLVSTLQIEQDMQLRHWERLCAYVLQKAKDHVQYCGGASQIAVLDSRGAVKYVPQHIIREDEFSTGLVMDKVRWLFNWSDPVGWKADLAKMEKVIDDIGRMLKIDMRAHVAELRARDTLSGLGGRSILPLPTDDRPSQPPSPGSPEESDEP